MRTRSLLMALGVAYCCALGGRAAVAAEWDPALFDDAETLELRTIGAEEGEYWFPVWVVVIDGQVFIRLGSRAAERVQGNQTGAEVAVRVNGEQFDHVRTEDAAEYASRVDAAMAEKYWSDVFVRFFPHPLTLRLTVDAAGADQVRARRH